MNLLKDIKVNFGLGRNRSIPDPFEVGLAETVRVVETVVISRAPEATMGNQKKAAELLGVKHTTLNAKIQRMGIDAGMIRSASKRPSVVG
jgi:DNA-binding NtrC family response regulator